MNAISDRAGGRRLPGWFHRDGRVLRLSLAQVAIVIGLAAFALVGWQLATTVGRRGAIDAGEYLLNAQYLDAHGRLPPDYVSYEYSSPPLFTVLAVAANHVLRWAPSIRLESPWNLATRLVWLTLVAAAAWCLASGRARLRMLGLAVLAVAVAWGLDEAISLAKTEAWSSGQLLALAAAGGLVIVSGLIAREVWPDHPRRSLATMGFVVAYPVVLRVGVLFHPETTMALLSSLATLVVIRAERRGWPPVLGVATGVLCGLDLLTRQSALVVCVCVVLAVIVVGRRRARRFLTMTLVALALVSGPWLGYATYEWGNPLQGNLERPNGGMLVHGEPASFFLSFPIAALVEHPYRPSFTNELLPQLHAELWSDWFGALHDWGHTSRLDRVTASSQSVLGFVADALALVGLFACGLSALTRVARARRRSASDFALGLLALLAVTGFVVFVAQIIRYPQTGGREIKSSYLLFTAPCWAVFSVAAWLELARRRRRANVVLAFVAALYAVSYGSSLAATLSHRWPTQLALVEPSGFVDLKTSIQAVNAPQARTEADFAVKVTDVGTGGAIDSRVEIRLDPAMTLLARPHLSQGSGCTGTRTLECSLGLVPAGVTAQVRVAVRLAQSGVETLAASATEYGIDAHPADNASSLTFVVP